jgi:hypothetical protein
MNPSPPGDEDLQMAQNEKPRPRLLEDALSKGEPPSGDPIESDGGFTGTGRLTFIGSLILITIAFSVGFSYLLQHRAAVRNASSVSRDDATTAAPEPEAPVNPAIVLQEDMFRVTAIAMGEAPLAIVNGKRVGAGESLVVNTPEGPAKVRITKIEDGLVRFAYGQQHVEAKVPSTVAQKPPP